MKGVKGVNGEFCDAHAHDEHCFGGPRRADGVKLRDPAAGGMRDMRSRAGWMIFDGGGMAPTQTHRVRRTAAAFGQPVLQVFLPEEELEEGVGPRAVRALGRRSRTAQAATKNSDIVMSRTRSPVPCVSPAAR